MAGFRRDLSTTVEVEEEGGGRREGGGGGGVQQDRGHQAEFWDQREAVGLDCYLGEGDDEVEEGGGEVVAFSGHGGFGEGGGGGGGEGGLGSGGLGLGLGMRGVGRGEVGVVAIGAEGPVFLDEVRAGAELVCVEGCFEDRVLDCG